MSAPPFMPLFVGDYLADTTHLTCTEHGAYILLLMSMWRAGGALPDDPGKLARFARCSTGQWARISDTILAFFDRADGVISHGRLVREMAKHAVAVEQRRQAASNGGKAKALKNKDTGLPGASSPLCQPEPEPEKKEISEAKASSPRTASPSGFPEFWDAYPSKVGKRAAEAAYGRAVRRATGPDPPLTILAGVERAKLSRRWIDGYVPNPQTWLNQDRWTDEPGEPPPQPRQAHERTAPRPDARQAAYRERLGDIGAAMEAAFQQPRREH